MAYLCDTEIGLKESMVITNSDGLLSGVVYMKPWLSALLYNPNK